MCVSTRHCLLHAAAFCPFLDSLPTPCALRGDLGRGWVPGDGLSCPREPAVSRAPYGEVEAPMAVSGWFGAVPQQALCP